MDKAAPDSSIHKAGFKIEIISGSLKGTSYPISDTRVTLGRSSEADIRIDDTLISRVHCALTYSNGQWFMEDLGSTNGTWVVGQRLKNKAFLPFNTPVRVGKTMFELVDNSKERAGFSDTNWSLDLHLAGDVIADEVEQPAGEDFPLGSTNRLLDSIYHFQNTIAGIQSEHELYPKMLFSVSRIMSDYDAYVLVYDIETSQFAVKASRNNAGPLKNASIDQLNMALIDYVRETRDSAVFHSQEGKSAVIVPIRGKQQLDGMFYLAGLASRITEFRSEELRMLTVLGYIAGAALEHSRAAETGGKRDHVCASGAAASELAHYINNITTGLDGCIGLLRIGIDEGDKILSDDAWEILNKNNRRLSNIVQDLLNLSSEQYLKLSVQNISALVKEVYEQSKDQLSAGDIRLTVENRMGSAQVLAEVDANAFKRVLSNLIFNAEHSILSKEFSRGNEKPGGSIQVSYRISDSKGTLIMSVKDDGAGFDAETVKQIFNLHISPGGSPGTSLALAVCKRIIQAHGGKITAQSEEGRGSVFAFEIPVTRSDVDTNTSPMKRID